MAFLEDNKPYGKLVGLIKLLARRETQADKPPSVALGMITLMLILIDKLPRGVVSMFLQ